MLRRSMRLMSVDLRLLIEKESEKQTDIYTITPKKDF